MRGAIRIGKIAGIEIAVHYTLLLAFILFAWSFAQGYFPQYYPRWTQTTYWAAGVVTALALFVCILVHEMAHSLVAKSRGLPVQSITLFIFGGVSNIAEEPRKPGVEFVMSFVGPLSSLALAGIFWLVSRALPDPNDPVTAVLKYLGSINLLLGLFNLIPGFPLDGGRVFRSIVWAVTGNLNRATNIASLVGQAFGWGFIGYGLFQVFGGNLIGGIWIAFIGWFLNSAAESSRQQLSLQEHLKGVRVKDVMQPEPETIKPGTSVEETVNHIFLQHQLRAVPIADNEHLLGIVTLTDVKRLAKNEWAFTPVERIMTRQPLYTVSLDDELSIAMKIMAEHDLNQLLVLNEGKLAGMLSRADIIRHLQLAQELGMTPGRRK